MKDDLKLLAPDEFPALLREIPDRPKQLHLRGTLPSSENKWLAIVGSLGREILEKGGALLSEEKPDMRATDYTFPKRNRVMAGLCHATLMVEAKEKSGSLITAKLTTEYNRDLLVVPGNIFSEESRGTHQFLRLGATAVTSPEDVLIALGISKREGAASLNELREDLSDDEKRVFEIIMTPRPRDELLDALDLSISDANVLLSTMEIKGLIVEELGVVRIR